MIFKTLENTNIDEIIACFLISFENYFVKMPSDYNYYKNRWALAKVDYTLSFGAFEKDELIGFIIHAVDKREGKNIAYNTGTGIVPKHRGKKIIQNLYTFAIPVLKQNGIDLCRLEVIKENYIALKAYQRVGFKITRNYKCYRGKINLKPQQVPILSIPYAETPWDQLKFNSNYCWDHQNETIRNGKFQYYQILNDEKPSSYFIIDPKNGNLLQFETLVKSDKEMDRLFAGIQHISDTVKINNVDESFTAKINFIEKMKLGNPADQYEMDYII